MLPKRINLIGYVRPGQSLVSGIEQLNALKTHCRSHGYNLVAVFTDTERPAFGLSQALQAMKRADGLIVFDCQRLVENPADTYRELRPLLENQFMHTRKKFVSISEGIENITPMGQENLVETLNEWSRREEMPTATYDVSQHRGYTPPESVSGFGF
ncbi:MAG TPA: recombinase family protein [Chroococcales cyanobacterium]